ncbi:hypothetical protein WAI453_001087 [Rhynchosporium graminicola]
MWKIISHIPTEEDTQNTQCKQLYVVNKIYPSYECSYSKHVSFSSIYEYYCFEPHSPLPPPLRCTIGAAVGQPPQPSERYR